MFGGMPQVYDKANPHDVLPLFMETLNDSSVNITEPPIVAYDIEGGSKEDEDVEEMEDGDAYGQDALEEVDDAAFSEAVKEIKGELSTTPRSKKLAWFERGRKCPWTLSTARTKPASAIGSESKRKSSTSCFASKCR
jgi:hypothetical protein